MAINWMTPGDGKVDYSWIGSLADKYQEGDAWRDSKDLQKVFKNGLPRDANGNIDWDKSVEMIGTKSPELAYKFMASSGSDNQFGANIQPAYNNRTGQWEFIQPNKGGGASAIPDYSPPMGGTWIETDQGYKFVPSKTPGYQNQPYPMQPPPHQPQQPTLPPSQQNPQQVDGVYDPASDIEELPPPGYSVQPRQPQPEFGDPGTGQYPQQGDQSIMPYTQGDQPPGVIPSVGSEKLKDDRREKKGTATALAQATKLAVDESIRNFEEIINSPDLEAVTGNYRLNGIDTGVPNSFIPGYTQRARDIEARIGTAAVQVGLNMLEQMRAMSAQGASGMGQLAIKESEWLQNSRGSLALSQGTPQFKVEAQKIIDHFKALKGIVDAKYNEMYGGGGVPTIPGVAPPQGNMPRTLIDIDGNPL